MYIHMHCTAYTYIDALDVSIGAIGRSNATCSGSKSSLVAYCALSVSLIAIT